MQAFRQLDGDAGAIDDADLFQHARIHLGFGDGRGAHHHAVVSFARLVFPLVQAAFVEAVGFEVDGQRAVRVAEANDAGALADIGGGQVQRVGWYEHGRAAVGVRAAYRGVLAVGADFQESFFFRHILNCPSVARDGALLFKVEFGVCRARDRPDKKQIHLGSTDKSCYHSILAAIWFCVETAAAKKNVTAGLGLGRWAEGLLHASQGCLAAPQVSIGFAGRLLNLRLPGAFRFLVLFAQPGVFGLLQIFFRAPSRFQQPELGGLLVELLFQGIWRHAVHDTRSLGRESFDCGGNGGVRFDAGRGGNKKAQSETGLFHEFGGVADGARTHDNRNHNPPIKAAQDQ